MEAAATCSKCSETIAMAHGCCLVKGCRKGALPPLEAVADTVAVKLPAHKATECRSALAPVVQAARLNEMDIKPG